MILLLRPEIPRHESWNLDQQQDRVIVSSLEEIHCHQRKSKGIL